MKTIVFSLIILAGSFLFPQQSQSQTRINHQDATEYWIDKFSRSSVVQLDAFAAAGYMRKVGNDYFTILPITEIYPVGCVFVELDKQLPLKPLRWFAFKITSKDTIVYEPSYSAVVEVKITPAKGGNKIRLTSIEDTNLGNISMGSLYMDLNKVYVTKAERLTKIKEKESLTALKVAK